MADFGDGTPAVCRPVRNFDVSGLFRAVEEPDGEAEPLFGEPQAEHLGKVGVGMFPQDFVEFFLVQGECGSVILSEA